MCILSGCDYLSSIKETGIKKAFADVKRNKDISATIRYFRTHRKLDFPVDYESLHCFKSQTVIDQLTLTPLSPLAWKYRPKNRKGYSVI